MKQYYVLCRTCNGSGYVTQPIPAFVDIVTSANAAEICPVCKGTKQQIITEHETEE